MAIFQYKIIIFQGQFSIISACSMENSQTSRHIYCNSQYLHVERGLRLGSKSLPDATEADEPEDLAALMQNTSFLTQVHHS